MQRIQAHRCWRCVALFVAPLLAACADDRGRARGADPGSDAAELILVLSLGEEAAASPEYQFASILSLLPAPDGRLWVLDGTSVGLTGQTPLLRQFDSSGNFLRQVGREGSGPGEYRAPFALGLARDGRVALRDYSIPGRITLYAPDGELSETWSLGPTLHSVFAPSNIDVDPAGVMWLNFSGTPRNRDAPSGILRVRPDGTILDTITPPPIPEVERETLRIVRTTASGGTSIRGFTVPYQPQGTRAWSPTGEFALARTDQYRIEILPAPGHTGPERQGEGSMPPPPPRVVSRDVPPVPVPEQERAAAREELRERVQAYDPGSGLRIPEIPTHKPPIKHLWFAADGKLWVSVSMPSRLEGDEWREPSAYDIFDLAGEYLGRVVLPESFSPRWMQGEYLWGVYSGPLDVESVRRYRIVWPPGIERL